MIVVLPPGSFTMTTVPFPTLTSSRVSGVRPVLMMTCGLGEATRSRTASFRKAVTSLPGSAPRYFSQSGRGGRGGIRLATLVSASVMTIPLSPPFCEKVPVLVLPSGRPQV